MITHGGDMVKKTIILLMSLMIVGLVSAQTSFPGETNAIVNMRSGAGTGFDVVRTLEARTPLTLIGRTDDRNWLLAAVEDGTQGWIFYVYVDAFGAVRELPVTDAAGTVVPQPAAPEETGSEEEPVETTVVQPTTASVAAPANLISRVTATSQRIFRNGQTMGNRADVFSKVGDSITASDLFLNPIGHGAYNLADYGYLQSVIDYFSQTGARDHFSFANSSLAARGGFTTSLVLNPEFAVPGVCQPGETPLVCEYRVVHPSVALIMLGTNDVAYVDIGTFSANLRTIVQTSIDMGVIPVLSTIPDQPNLPTAALVPAYNRVINSISAAYDVPLWDLNGALNGLHNQGLSEDNVHPSYNPTLGTTAVFTPEALQYGYNVRNLTALQVLDVLWRRVLSQ